MTRLLADVLNSPSGGCMPEEDAKEVATEGQDRPGAYIVRKGHFTLIDDNGPGPVVPRPHRLAWRRLTDERIVFLVRDPRDICISGAHHWRQTPEQFLERMIKGDVAKCGRWDEYVNGWRTVLDSMEWDSIFVPSLRMNVRSTLIRYEDLIESPWACLACINARLACMARFGITLDTSEDESVSLAIDRQSFANRQAQIGNNPAELRRNNMRKGIVGDWRNHFTPAMNERIWGEFGWVMEGLGYDKDNL